MDAEGALDDTLVERWNKLHQPTHIPVQLRSSARHWKVQPEYCFSREEGAYSEANS
jgi:hypothetical protein